MSSFLYKKIWHGISIHTRKCIPENALDKDSFSKMSYSERLHLKDTQPEVYENLIKQMIK